MTTSDLVILRLAIDGIEARVRKAYEETGAAKSIGSFQWPHGRLSQKRWTTLGTTSTTLSKSWKR